MRQHYSTTHVQKYVEETAQIILHQHAEKITHLKHDKTTTTTTTTTTKSMACSSHGHRLTELACCPRGLQAVGRAQAGWPAVHGPVQQDDPIIQKTEGGWAARPLNDKTT